VNLIGTLETMMTLHWLHLRALMTDLWLQGESCATESSSTPPLWFILTECMS
jgi:hypothetical protein